MTTDSSNKDIKGGIKSIPSGLLRPKSPQVPKLEPIAEVRPITSQTSSSLIKDSASTSIDTKGLNSEVPSITASEVIRATKKVVESNKKIEIDFSSKNMETILTQLGVKASHIKIALDRADKTREPLSVIMRDFGFLSAEKVAIAVAGVSDLEYFSMEDANALSKSDLPEIKFKKFENVIPVGIHNSNKKELIVAVSDPDQASAASTVLSDHKGFRVAKIVIASEHTIQTVYRRFYSNTDVDFDDLVSRFESSVKSATSVKANADADTGVVQHIYLALIRHACYSGASDLYLYKSEHVGIVKLKINGVGLIFRTITMELYDRILNRLVQDNTKADDLRVRPKESVIELSDDDKRRIPDIAARFNFRLELTESRQIRNAVIRILDRNSAATDLSNLGFSTEALDTLTQVSRKATGFFLVTGPTGSGKTTSLYALLKSIDPVERSIQSIEDPIEYRHGLWQQYELRKDAEDKKAEYNEWLKALLRNAPDVILVGEVRDKEVADVCLNAANTGHLVFATLHTNNAVLAVGRLKALGVDLDLLGSVMLGILAQRLLRTLCPVCKVPDDSEYVADVFKDYQHVIRGSSGLTPHKAGSGCEHCGHTGYFGRQAVYEILEAKKEVRQALEANKPTSEIASAGMELDKTMWASGLKLVATGVTSINELERMVNRD